MTLGKSHLVATIPLFVAAMAYNIWYFNASDTKAPARAVGVEAAATGTAGPSVSGESAPVDPTQLPPVADVVLDKLPQWRRNPFASAQRPVAVLDDAPVAEVAQAPPEADIVVSLIMYSANRKLARVNGRTVRIGDRVGTATVVDILPNAIVIESSTQGRRTVGRQRTARQGTGAR